MNTISELLQPFISSQTVLWPENIYSNPISFVAVSIVCSYWFNLLLYAARVSLTLARFIEQYTARRDAAFDVLRNRPTMLFIGAGVGADIYPLWGALLGRLLEATELTLSEEGKGWTPPQIAQYIKNNKEEIYTNVIREHFQSYKPTVERIVQHIQSLPMQGIITTNYDNALDEATETKGFKSVKLGEIHPKILTEEGNYIFHIHGFIDSEASEDSHLQIILSEDEYRYFYKEVPTVGNFLRNALADFNIIFVGFSLLDPYVMDIIKEVSLIEQQSKENNLPYKTMERYALCELEVTNESSRRFIDWNYIEEKESYLSQYGIIPVWYEKGNNYRGLNELIRDWANKFGVEAAGIAERIPEKP